MLESLEARVLLAADPVISEFLAVNSNGIADSFGDRSDWIEIYNYTGASVNLDGWYLTDDAATLTKWRFPSVSIQSGGYLLVFASDRDIAVAGQELHTNFKLSGEGEYLGLVKPDGVTVAYDFGQAFPPQQANISYGLPMGSSVFFSSLVSGAADKAFVPTDSTLGLTWTERTFDDSSWTLTGATGVGYETQSGYESLIRTDVKSAMYNVNTSCYIRVPFTIDAPASLSKLMLMMKYDDGYVAYINGVKVASKYAPTPPAWNSMATGSHADGAAVIFESMDISSAISALVPGTNVLAIQGLNATSTADTDFLILPELVAIGQGPPGDQAGYLLIPTPRASNGSIVVGLVGDTKFSQDRGYYDTAFPLAITCDTPGATIRYTTDGSVPTASTGIVYTGAITIGATTVVRAAGFKSGYQPSNVDTQTYVFVESVINQSSNPPGFPTTWGANPVDYAMDPAIINDPVYGLEIRDDLKSLPTISLVANPADLFGANGIYSNPLESGVAWERATSAEWINPDGSEGFQIDAGLRIQGGTGRNPLCYKHSLRLLFKSGYGDPKLKYDMFGEGAVDEFDTLILRAGFNDSWTPGGSRDQAQFVRDQWSREVGLAMGRPEAHGRFVNVYINGLYWGMYNIVERPSAPFAASYLGGNKDEYDVMESYECIDGNPDAWNTALNIASSGLYTPEQYQAIKQYVDVDNLIDFVLVEFYDGNIDWPANNWYAARRRAEGETFKFFLWDTELSWGFNNVPTWQNHQLDVNRTTVYAWNTPVFFYSRLRSNSEFCLLFADHVYEQMFNDGPLTPQAGADLLTSLDAGIEQALVGESARWGDARSATLVTRDVQWDAERSWLLSAWFPQRTGILLQQLKDIGLYPSIDAPNFNQHGGTVASGFKLTMGGTTGTIYYTTNGEDPRDTSQPDGLSPNARIYDPANPDLVLTANTQIKARALSGGTWSAIDDTAFVVDPGMVKITELMYNPPSGNDDLEFVELFNSGSGLADVSGMRFAQGIDYTFPAGTILAPGQRVVLVHFDPLAEPAKAQAFEGAYGVTGVSLMGPYLGLLSNSGEQVQMVDTANNILADFTYSDSGDWPGRADGNGSSLELASLTLPFDRLYDRQNWRPSAEYNGTPGSAGAGEQRDVQINEVLTHTDPPQSDSVELYNNTDSAIDIGGWRLSDSTSNYLKYRIPSGPTIPARGYIVFNESDFNPTPLAPGANDFSFNGAHGDDVYLVTVDDAGQPVRFVDHVSFGAALNGVSFGRSPNGTGELYPMQRATLGYDNSYARIGPVVISEVMYCPPLLPGGLDDIDNEFIELYNPTGSAITLSNWFDTNNNHVQEAGEVQSWKLAKGVDYAFPVGTSIASHGTVVVVGFDPAVEPAKLASFRSKYGIGTGVTVLGPWQGKLSNSDESVALLRPDTPPVDELTYTPYILVDEAAYDVSAPWDSPGSGNGQSMQRQQWMLVGDQGGNWFGGAPTPGGVSFPTSAPPTVLASSVNGGQQQRSMVKSLSVHFSADVGSSLAASDMVLHNLTTGTDVRGSALSLAYDPATFTATWTWAGLAQGTLTEGYYLATLSPAGVMDDSGIPLDGNGDGVAGDDYTFAFHRLAGDASGDGMVDVGDLGILGANYGRTGPNLPGDMDMSGVVDLGDLGILGFNYGRALGTASMGLAAGLDLPEGAGLADAAVFDAPVPSPVMPTETAWPADSPADDSALANEPILLAQASQPIRVASQVAIPASGVVTTVPPTVFGDMLLADNPASLDASLVDALSAVTLHDPLAV